MSLFSSDWDRAAVGVSVLLKLGWGSVGCVCSLQTGMEQSWVSLFSSNWDVAALGVSVLFRLGLGSGGCLFSSNSDGAAVGVSVLFKLRWGSGGYVCSLQTGMGQRWVCLFSSCLHISSFYP